MIIGGDKKTVIENIKKATESNLLNIKVEENDAVLTDREKNNITDRYLKNLPTFSYKFKRIWANALASVLTNILNKDTEIINPENYTSINGGAIITSNHFNPIDSTPIRLLCKKYGHKRLYTVSRESNFVMPGVVGFLMNYADTIPISDNIRYTSSDFAGIIEKHLKKGKNVLIYPEQEMWFNYKKPRPLKIGAYHYAAKYNVPIVSCFVEMRETDQNDNGQFKKVKYTLHVLPPIYPSPDKSPRENSRMMQQVDTQQKTEAYERIYNKKLDYSFDYSDIAGYIMGN